MRHSTSRSLFAVALARAVMLTSTIPLPPIEIPAAPIVPKPLSKNQRKAERRKYRKQNR